MLSCDFCSFLKNAFGRLRLMFWELNKTMRLDTNFWEHGFQTLQIKFPFLCFLYYAITKVFEINLQISMVAIYHKFSIKLGFLPGSLFPRTRIYQIRLAYFQMQSIYQIIQIQIKENPFPGNYFFYIFPSFVGDIFSLNFQKKKDSWVSKLAMNYALT